MLLPNVYKLGYTVGETLQQVLSKQHEELPAIPTPAEAWHMIVSFPRAYQQWWLALARADPIHVVIETTLLLSVVYMLILNRQKDWRELDKKEKLTSKEKQELLQEWKERGRAPLAPPSSGELAPLQQLHNNIVVHSMNGRTMDVEILGESSEGHVVDGNSASSSSSSPPKKQQPSRPNKRRTVLNFATHDFLGMSASQQVKDASKAALAKYGCGSCGPRGFYGTIDVHLQLEEAMAKFTKTEGAIMYSDGASTVSSTVAAFAKRGDLLVVDDGIYEPLVTGVTLSRANVKWFKHNDMADLRRVLESVARTDKAIGRKTNAQRRFIVVEGLYKNSGTIVPLEELVALKHEFHYRLILDESFSFGTLGPEHGTGVLELYGQRHMYDAEIVTISLENALGSIGGVTVGNEEIVDHQRLSGAGYCFSASCPPFTASAAISALSQMQQDTELLVLLRRNVTYVYEQIRKVLLPKSLLVVTSDERSPIVFVELSESFRSKMDANQNEETILASIEKHCLMESDVAIVVTPYRPQQGTRTGGGGGGTTTNQAVVSLPPSIRLNISALHRHSDIDKALEAISKAMDQCCSGGCAASNGSTK